MQTDTTGNGRHSQETSPIAKEESTLYAATKIPPKCTKKPNRPLQKTSRHAMRVYDLLQGSMTNK